MVKLSVLCVTITVSITNNIVCNFDEFVTNIGHAIQQKMLEYHYVPTLPSLPCQ